MRRMWGDNIHCHQPGCVASLLHRCCSGLVPGIPVPSCFALTLGEAEIRQTLTEVTLLNTQQWAFTQEEKIWFSSSCSNDQNLWSFPLIWCQVWGLMPAIILKGSPLAWLHYITSGTVNPIQCMWFTTITYLVKSLLATSVQSESHNPGKPLWVTLMAQS